MAQKIKAATAIAKMVRIIVFLLSMTLARYRRLREPKVNGGRNASLGTDYGLPEAKIQLTQLSGAPFFF
jgi:hypothetical protein